jgi:hypothetical protein
MDASLATKHGRMNGGNSGHPALFVSKSAGQAGGTQSRSWCGQAECVPPVAPWPDTMKADAAPVFPQWATVGRDTTSRLPGKGADVNGQGVNTLPSHRGVSRRSYSPRAGASRRKGTDQSRTASRAQFVACASRCLFRALQFLGRAA